MPGLFDINEGSRPSRLQLGRYATGELEGAELHEIEAGLDNAARAHLAELDAAKAAVPALDLAALRSRAAEIDDATETDASTAPSPPRAANNWRWFAPVMLLAAVMVLAIMPDPTLLFGSPQATTTLKGGGLLVYQLHADDGQLRPYTGNSLGQGDSIGFRVNGGHHESVGVLSVDGDGTVTVLYPEDGEQPVDLGGSGDTVALPGTIILDDAPGPEVFIAVFDMTTDDARDALHEVWQQGGTDAVLRWADADRRADAVLVERR